MNSLAFTDAERDAALRLIQLALEEDLGATGDVTSTALVPEQQPATVQIVSRSPGVLAGLPIVPLVFARLDPNVRCTPLVEDGALLGRGTVVAELSGSLRSLLTGERTVLNFLTHLSGVASLTRQYVTAIAGTRAGIYDTRKTLPGWRVLQKYAVRAGGGRNHRMGLFDMVLIKDNHLAGWSAGGPATERTIAAAISAAREQAAAGMKVEVEVDTFEQLAGALAGNPDIILLDNMTCDQLRQAVALRDRVAPQIELEASGGVSLATVGDIARTGVDRISSGALTHSAVALDLGLDWKTG